MMFKKILKSKKLNLYILLFALIFLSIIPLIRIFFYDSVVIGRESYYHLRIAEDIIEKGIPDFDSSSNSDYTFNPMHALLALFIFIFGEKFVSFIYPLILGMSSLYFYLKILDKFNFKPIHTLFNSFILILSPIFIFLFSTLNSFSLPLFLIILGFYFFMRDKHKILFFLRKENKFNFYISLLVFALIPLFGAFNLLIAFFVLLAYVAMNKERIKNFYILTFILILSYLIYSPRYIYPFNLPSSIILSITSLNNILFEMGSMYGFRIFTLVLAMIGFFSLWSENKNGNSLFILLLLTLLSIIIPNLMIYLIFILAIPAAYGLLSLFKMKWRVNLIKKLTLVILISSLIISSITYFGILSSSLPEEEVIDALNRLKLNSKKDEIVLSTPNNSFWIQKISGLSTFIDSTIEHTIDYEDKFNITSTVFYSRNLKETSFFLENNNIDFILITEDMKKGEIWTKSDHGLLFLLENSKIFKKIYSRDSIEIWEFN